MSDLVILRPEETDIHEEDVNALWHALDLVLEKARDDFMREQIRSRKLTVKDLDKLVLVQYDGGLDVAYETATGVQVLLPVTFELRLKEKNDAH